MRPAEFRCGAPAKHERTKELSANQSINQSIDRCSFNQSINHTVFNQSINRTIFTQSINQPNDFHTINQSNENPTNQSIKQTIIDRMITQPINQSTEQSVNEKIFLPFFQLDSIFFFWIFYSTKAIDKVCTSNRKKIPWPSGRNRGTSWRPVRKRPAYYSRPSRNFPPPCRISWRIPAHRGRYRPSRGFRPPWRSAQTRAWSYWGPAEIGRWSSWRDSCTPESSRERQSPARGQCARECARGQSGWSSRA